MTPRHLMLGVAIALAAACTASGSVHGGMTVVYSEPPQSKLETPRTKPNHVWVKGHWDFQNGQWSWINGRWERERPGARWHEGRWERRGNAWYWIDGTWVGGAVVGVTVSSDHPTEGPPPRMEDHGAVITTEDPNEEPPPPQAESYGTNKGHVWISGRWEWKNNKWAWSAGRWEPERPRQVWHPGKWQRQGNRWIWVEGRWKKR